jgi:hypothetical protein
MFVKTDGTLWAMGANGYGQLGDGTTTQRLLPVQVATEVAAVSTGFYTTTILRRDGTVWTFGYNSSGQVGDGTTENRITPVQVGSGVTAIASGGGHSLLLRTDGTLWTMGNNDYGQLGDGTTLDRSVPVQVATDVVSFAGAWVTTFWVKRDGSLWSAGRNAEGQLGLGHYDTPPGPSPVPGTGVTSASATLALAPVVTQPPASVMSVPGAAVTFAVTAEGFPVPTYQWQRNGVAIPAATNATYTIPTVTAANAGSYDVVVTNPAGSVTSSAAALILASLQLEGSAFYLPGGGTVTAHASLNYTSLQPTALGFLVEVPAGWSLASVSGTTVPGVSPPPGTTGNLEFAYTTMPANEAAFSLVLNYPAGLSGAQQLRATATYRSPLQTQTLAPLTLTRLDAPAVTAAPAGGVRRAGTPFTLSVAATSLVPATYQWRKDGANLPGATAAQLVFASLQLADAGTYSVAVSNPGGSTISPSTALAVIEVQATHAVSGSGYLPGGTVTVNNTVTYSPALSGLTWEVLPPPGWTYIGGSGTEGTSRPAAGAKDLLTWSWTPVPAGSVQFSYQLQAPANATSDVSLAALVRPALAAGSLEALVLPDPLPLPSAQRHSADTNRDLLLSLLELTRVIELYNTRNAQVRTGAYQVLAGSEDGFTADSARSATAVVSLSRHHSADTDRNGRLSLFELTRVIELYNHRESGTRTGRYRIQIGTEDGFAPGAGP